jgi:transglutaminase-like putative cysteine protease
MTLSREQRDTGFLIGVVALAIGPHLWRVPLWAAALALALLAWRAALAWRTKALPARWILLLIAVAAAVGAKLSHGVLVGRASGLTLVSILLALKLLEMHGRRDAFVVFFLGFFLVLTQFLYSQALWVAAWTLLSVWGLLTALVLAQMPLGQPSLKIAAREAARTTAFGLPVMVLLFLLFPRIGPLWGVPSHTGSAGLSDEMSFGDVSTLALDERIALRLRPIEGRLPPPGQFYLRGRVLTVFDGQAWKPANAVAAPPEALVLSGGVLRYEMMLEPLRASVLPVLEHSPGQPGETWQLEGLTLQRSPDLSWVAPRPMTETLRVEAVAVPPSGVQRGPFDEHPSLRAARVLPPGLNPRMRDWSQALRARAGSDAAFVQAVLSHIRQSPFSYTLNPGVYGEFTPHGIDEFWFDRRLGFCEHYASAFVVALRNAGVPARVVTGYQGHDPEPQDGWTVVRNANAHAWAEYWLPGQGWLRADPTGAVAPERVERGLALIAPTGVLRGAIDAVNPTLWAGLRRMAEGLDLRWQAWVLDYKRDQQFKLLDDLGFDAPDWTALGQVAAGTIALLATLTLAWQRWQARRRDAWPQRLARVHASLRERGWSARPNEAPLRWAQAVREAGGPPAAAQALVELEAWRYGPEATPAEGWRERRREAARWRAWWRRWRQALKGSA